METVILAEKVEQDFDHNFNRPELLPLPTIAYRLGHLPLLGEGAAPDRF